MRILSWFTLPRRASRSRRFDLEELDRHLLAGHVLQKRDDRQDFIVTQSDRLLVDVRHLGRKGFGLADVLVVLIDVGLRLGQALVEEVPCQLGPNALQIRTPTFDGSNRMAQGALTLAEKDLLPDRSHVL